MFEIVLSLIFDILNVVPVFVVVLILFGFLNSCIN